MALPVVQNTQTNSGTSIGSIDATKPTGLAVGDLMVAFVAYYDAGSSATVTTPAGWTSVREEEGTDTGQVCYTKVADSGDVAASLFTFTFSTTVDIGCVVLMRVDSFNTVGSSEIDVASTETDGVLSFTTAITPTSPNNLIITSYSGADATWTGTPSASAYASTPTKTFTEKADVGAKNSNLGLILAVATADNTNLDQITNRTATFNDTPAEGNSSIVLIIEGTYDTTGTNTLLAVSPTFFTQNGSAGTTGTNALHAPSPEFFDQSGFANSPTQWANPNKESTTWTNPNKP